MMKATELVKHVAKQGDLGRRDVSHTLKESVMPAGYALIQTSDMMFYFWLRWDGVQSTNSTDRWKVWEWAHKNAKKLAREGQKEEGHFNQLTPAQAERLAILLEELGEAQQAIGKILRHGYDSVNPLVLGSPTNRKNLEKELGDVQCAIDRLCQARDIRRGAVNTWASKKQLLATPYLHHQAE